MTARAIGEVSTGSVLMTVDTSSGAGALTRLVDDDLVRHVETGRGTGEAGPRERTRWIIDLRLSGDFSADVTRRAARDGRAPPSRYRTARRRSARRGGRGGACPRRIPVGPPRRRSSGPPHSVRTAMPWSTSSTREISTGADTPGNRWSGSADEARSAPNRAWKAATSPPGSWYRGTSCPSGVRATACGSGLVPRVRDDSAPSSESQGVPAMTAAAGVTPFAITSPSRRFPPSQRCSHPTAAVTVSWRAMSGCARRTTAANPVRVAPIGPVRTAATRPGPAP